LSPIAKGEVPADNENSAFKLKTQVAISFVGNNSVGRRIAQINTRLRYASPWQAAGKIGTCFGGLGVVVSVSRCSTWDA